MARLTEFAEWVKGTPKDLKWVEHFESIAGLAGVSWSTPEISGTK